MAEKRQWQAALSHWIEERRNIQHGRPVRHLDHPRGREAEHLYRHYDRAQQAHGADP